MNQPKQPNPALLQPQYVAPQQPHPSQPPQGYPQQPGAPQQPQGYPPQQQPAPGYPQQQQQAPLQQQQPGGGLVNPSGQPVQQAAPQPPQQFFPVQLTPDGPVLPTPTLDATALMQYLPQGQAPYSMIITWIEMSRAFNQHDFQIAWLDRRLRDIEKKLEIEPISAEAFMEEEQARIQELMRQQAAQQSTQPAQGQAPQPGQQPGQPGQPAGS